MKIVLIGLASIFTEGMTYQDNLLSEQINNDGHDVTIIADCYMYENSKVIKTGEIDKVLESGIRLIRKKYKWYINEFLSGKIRAVNGLYDLLSEINPDVIFNHGLQTYEMLTIAEYKRNNPNVKFFVDSHEDFHNSARNWLSKNILHRVFYKNIINKTIPFVDKVFCVTYESFEFLEIMYGLKREIMEYYPLGGIIIDERVRNEKRKRKREELGLIDSDILMIHSGKMDKLKRTEEILNTFSKVENEYIRLALIGTLNDEVKRSVEPLINLDERVYYLGWKNGEELLDYLCACDLYIQPGTQSATMQNAACCMCALALYPYPSHKYLFDNSVFYISNEDDMLSLFKSIKENSQLIHDKRNLSYNIACNSLDYRVLASKLYY